MKNFSLLFVGAMLWLTSLSAEAKLNVVATLPDYGAIASEIGGDKVKVTNLARGTEDPHFVDGKPSFIRTLNQADVLLEGGAELEIGWLPPLVNSARNRKILSDAPGHGIMSRGISMIDVPTGAVDRSMGDVHAAGNPHYALDPLNGKIIAANIADVFSKVDPKNKDYYTANLQKFKEQIDQKMVTWTKLMEPIRGTKIVTYHKSYDYFAKRFGLEIVGQIEPKPGIEPSATHINALVGRVKGERAKLVVIEPSRSQRTPQYVADAIGGKLLILPLMVGGDDKIKTYFDLFDYDIAKITTALKAKQ